MSYSIGQVAQMFSLTVPTLRYYDKEGLLLAVRRTGGGIRQFDKSDIERLRVVECLKKTGMPLKDIKLFLAWCQQGSRSIPERKQMFEERRQAVLKQMTELQNTLRMVEYKCWFYGVAEAAGEEEAPNAVPLEEIPESIRDFAAMLRQG